MPEAELHVLLTAFNPVTVREGTEENTAPTKTNDKMANFTLGFRHTFIH